MGNRHAILAKGETGTMLLAPLAGNCPERGHTGIPGTLTGIPGTLTGIPGKVTGIPGKDAGIPGKSHRQSQYAHREAR